MAQEIRRDFSFRAETHSSTGRGKPAAEETGCHLSLDKAMLQARYGASEQQVCFALQVSRSSFRYRSVAADDSALRLRIREITETRLHYGYRRVHILLRREGWRDNHKRIYRLYSEQGLSLCLKRPHRNKSAPRRQPQPQGLYPNHVWGMDFVSDAYLTCIGYVC